MPRITLYFSRILQPRSDCFLYCFVSLHLSLGHQPARVVRFFSYVCILMTRHHTTLSSLSLANLFVCMYNLALSTPPSHLHSSFISTSHSFSHIVVAPCLRYSIWIFSTLFFVFNERSYHAQWTPQYLYIVIRSDLYFLTHYLCYFFCQSTICCNQVMY